MMTMMTIRIYSVVVVRIKGILQIPVTVYPLRTTGFSQLSP